MLNFKFYHNFIRVLCAILVILLAMPPQLLWAQAGANSSRIGGTSFGTKAAGRLPGTSGPTFQSMPSPSAQTLQGPTYQVHILGEVSKPGTYRVPASTRLSEAIEIASGIRGSGTKRSIQLRRKGTKTRYIDLMSFKTYGNLEANPYLLDNDVVFVPLKRREVRIAGAVKRPATYEVGRNISLRSLIRLAGGFASGAALSVPAKVIRYNDEHKKVIEVGLSKKETLAFRLRHADTVVIPHILTKDKKFDYNLPTLPGDSGLFYPSFEERIFVIGAVYTPGPYPYSPYYSVREYLTLAGGLTKMAKEKKMRVIRSTGETVKAKHVTTINPGDTIVVPERYMSPEGWITLTLGVTSAVLGITTTILTLTR